MGKRETVKDVVQRWNGQDPCFDSCVEEGLGNNAFFNAVASKVWPWEAAKNYWFTTTYWTTASGRRAQRSVLTSPTGDCDAHSFENHSSKSSFLKTFHLLYELFLSHSCWMDHTLNCQPPVTPVYTSHTAEFYGASLCQSSHDNQEASWYQVQSQ